jgi:hypothetical protein
MAQPLKKRSEGRKKWEKGLDNSGNIEGNSFSRSPKLPLLKDERGG